MNLLKRFLYNISHPSKSKNQQAIKEIGLSEEWCQSPSKKDVQQTSALHPIQKK